MQLIRKIPHGARRRRRISQPRTSPRRNRDPASLHERGGPRSAPRRAIQRPERHRFPVVGGSSIRGRLSVYLEEKTALGRDGFVSRMFVSPAALLSRREDIPIASTLAAFPNRSFLRADLEKRLHLDNYGTGVPRCPGYPVPRVRRRYAPGKAGYDLRSNHGNNENLEIQGDQLERKRPIQVERTDVETL